MSIPQRKGDPKIVDTDERPRRDTSMEGLAKLRPAFKKEGGTVTAGNSSGLNDGAAAGVPPRIMGMGPVPATRKALERADLKLEDIGLVELNEAFAIQALGVMEGLGLDPGMVNVNGGGDCIGAPAGLLGGAHPDDFTA